MEPVARETIAARIERLEPIDAVAEPLQSAARKLLPDDSPLKDVLSGTWLGHPLHPLLTDVVIGSWTGAFVLDAAGAEGADVLVAAGIAAAVPTALSGLSDWADLPAGRSRRVGAVHALGNTAALLLHGASLAARLRGSRGRGRALSALGMGVAMASAWLGGHLSFGRGVGVDQTVFEERPDDWTPVADESDVVEGGLATGSANGTPVLLARQGGALWALLDRCSHRGCALHEGTLGDGVVICPCHGSAFRLEDGSVAKGPATAPQPRLEVRVREGRVEVRAPG